MIQELGNKKLYNEFEDVEVEKDDRVFCFRGTDVLIDDTGQLPRAKDFDDGQLQYLFRIDEERYFLNMGDPHDEKMEWVTVRLLRELPKRELAFATATAYHLYQWYCDNRYCGRCGEIVVHDHKERMLKCPACANMIFPKIAPAVIVAVTDGNKILFTKYNGRAYKKYALIAGFTEIGETAEETVAREVMEEVGLQVKNICYYKSQPWGTDSNLLLGFFAELDGENEIRLDEEELAIAEWFSREDMPIVDDGYSLTGEMMRIFKEGK